MDVNAVAGLYGHASAAAAYHARKGVVKALLNNGADVNLPGGNCGFALHAAAQGGHLGIIKVLLHHGANVHLQGGQFRFALTAGEPNSRVRRESDALTFIAVYRGNVRTMKVLLDQDASLNAADMENETVLHGAVFGGAILRLSSFSSNRALTPKSVGSRAEQLWIWLNRQDNSQLRICFVAGLMEIRIRTLGMQNRLPRTRSHSIPLTLSGCKPSD